MAIGNVKEGLGNAVIMMKLKFMVSVKLIRLN